MSKDQQEIQRLRRLRDRQVDARDPRHADRRRHQAVSQRPRETFSLRQELKALPAKVTWMIWGSLIGIFVGAFFGAGLYLAFGANWWAYLIAGAIVACAGLGYVFGAIKDSGKEDWRK
jgi:hypothetical protein